jgi:hypothetical protein
VGNRGWVGKAPDIKLRSHLIENGTYRFELSRQSVAGTVAMPAGFLGTVFGSSPPSYWR